MLAIDPASGSTSMPGWAMFRDGQLLGSGVLEIRGQTIGHKLAHLYNEVRVMTDQGVDTVVIEEIRGRVAHHYLLWAVGVIAAATSRAEWIELPVAFWKAIAPEGYVKSDRTDAEYIGKAVIQLAGEL